MDLADQAQVQAAPLNTVDHKRPEGPAYIGHCLNCGPDVPLPAPQRWCDSDCSNDWHQRQRRRS